MAPVAVLCLATVNAVAVDDLRPLFEAIRAVETSGLTDRDRQVGDGGRSIGPYQISCAYWADSGLRGQWRQCWGRAYSEAVMLAYWEHHCPEALRQRNYAVLARVHNGGPMGHMKRETLSYWKKVRQELGTGERPVRDANCVGGSNSCELFRKPTQDKGSPRVPDGKAPQKERSSSAARVPRLSVAEGQPGR